MAEFSYEDIYELLRGEKYSTDLQQITPEQLRKIHQYFESKRGLLQKQKESGLLDRAARDKLRVELENARRALRDMYERREKKVINRAVFTARSDFKVRDSTNFMPAEEKLYASMLDLLKESSVGFFSALKNAGSEKKAEPAIEEAIVVVALQAQVAAETVPSVESVKEIKILQAVPQLIGPDLKTYGPFNEAEIVKLPDELAGLLITQGKAQDVKVEPKAA